MARSRGRWIHIYLVALCVLCITVEVMAKAQPRRKRRKKSMDDQNMQSFFRMFKLIYAAVLIPLGGFLLYALLRDPVTPHIAKELWYRLQEAVTGQKIVIDDHGVARAVPRTGAEGAASSTAADATHQHQA